MSTQNLAQLLAQGVAAHEAGDLALAITCYESVLGEDGTNLQALQLSGIAYALCDDLPRAIERFSRAVELDPHDPFVRFNRANALSQARRYQEALQDLECALAREPHNEQGLLTRGNCLKSLGHDLQALASFDQAIEVNPSHSQAFNNRGVVLKDLGRPHEALQSYAQAISLNPRYVDAFVNLGVAFGTLGHQRQALQSYETALALDPKNAVAHNNRGNVLLDLGRHDEALASFEAATHLRPSYADAHSNRGNALKALGRLEEAMASYESALALNQGHAMALNNKGVLLREAGRLEQALSCFEWALVSEPGMVDALTNRGGAAYELGCLDEAAAYLERAIRIDPHYAAARLNKALLCLLLGNYAEGWPLYEDRLALEHDPSARVLLGRPWRGGEGVSGKTVLLYAEQGLGDTIQFCRYAKLVKALGARVLLEVPRPLVALLGRLDGVDALIEAGSQLPEYDLHCPLPSLPLAFKTTLQTIPSPASYLSAEPEKVAAWSARLGADRGLRVGVVWNGGFRKEQPALWAVNARRNIELGVFSAGLSSAGVSFYSLQKGEPAESEVLGRELELWPRGNFFNHASELADFSDTAALIANLDLVVSVDTSTAHLAAAMGKPTWVLNRHDTCWRWLLGRDDSPWYDSVKLYRQASDGDWGGVLARVASDLSKYK